MFKSNSTTPWITYSKSSTSCWSGRRHRSAVYDANDDGLWLSIANQINPYLLDLRQRFELIVPSGVVFDGNAIDVREYISGGKVKTKPSVGRSKRNDLKPFERHHSTVVIDFASGFELDVFEKVPKASTFGALGLISIQRIVGSRRQTRLLSNRCWPCRRWGHGQSRAATATKDQRNAEPLKPHAGTMPRTPGATQERGRTSAP